MARVHVWQYLLNEEGQPIGGADISVFLASSITPAVIYADERGGTANALGTLTTLSNGYFEFWIADDTEFGGYALDQKFKVKWEKSNVTSGFIDYFEVFNEPKGYAPVNVTDQNTTYNKLINNQLGYNWNQHLAKTTSDGVHGMQALDPAQTTATKDRILSNLQANKWEVHVDAMALSGVAASASPHGLETVDATDTNVQRNKLVSNNDIKDLTDGVDTIPTISNTTLTSGTSWTSGASYWYSRVNHTSSSEWPMVQVWDTDTRIFDEGVVFDIESVSAGQIELQTAQASGYNVIVKVLQES